MLSLHEIIKYVKLDGIPGHPSFCFGECHAVILNEITCVYFCTIWSNTEHLISPLSPLLYNEPSEWGRVFRLRLYSYLETVFRSFATIQ